MRVTATGLLSALCGSLSVSLSVCHSLSLSVCQSPCFSVCLSLPQSADVFSRCQAIEILYLFCSELISQTPCLVID